MNAAASPTIAPPPAEVAPLLQLAPEPLDVSPELVASQALRLLEVWSERRAGDEGGPAEIDALMVACAVDTVIEVHRAARAAVRR